LIIIKSWHLYQIMTFISNHDIYIKSWHLYQIMMYRLCGELSVEKVLVGLNMHCRLLLALGWLDGTYRTLWTGLMGEGYVSFTLGCFKLWRIMAYFTRRIMAYFTRRIMAYFMRRIMAYFMRRIMAYFIMEAILKRSMTIDFWISIKSFLGHLSLFYS